MMMQIVGSFAEFERAMLRERTRTGLDAARLFRVHPSTVVRLLAKHRHETATEA
jgi:DNA invertase Pin-like site-specific DNA recombinase